MGIRAEIFRWKLGDCSNGGLSSKVDTVTVISAEGPFQPDAEAPAVELKSIHVSGSHYDHVYAKPIGIKGHSMAGGTFIHSTDSRFGKAVEKLAGHEHHYPIALHDRVE